MPEAEFNDSDLLRAIERETGFDMTNMIIISKKIINDKLNVIYRCNRRKT